MLNKRMDEYKNREFMHFICRAFTLSLFGFALYGGISSLAWSQTTSTDTQGTTKQGESSKMLDNIKLQETIDAIRNVKIASLILDDPFSSYRGAVNEYDFRHHVGNCVYTVKDKMDIDRLIDILKNANIKMQDSAYPDVRTGIFLTLENGMELRFVFGGAFPGERDFDGLFNDQAISANKSLQGNLYQWAAKMKENQKKCHTITASYRTK